MLKNLFNNLFRSNNINKPKHKFVGDDSLYWLINTFIFFSNEFDDSSFKLFTLSDLKSVSSFKSDLEYLNNVVAEVSDIMRVKINPDDKIELLVEGALSAKINQDSGMYSEEGFSLAFIDFNFKDKSFKLYVESMVLTNPLVAYSVVALEIAHVKLNRMKDPILEEEVAALLTYYYGFGTLSINSHNSIITNENDRLEFSIGALPINERIFSLALFLFKFSIETPKNEISNYHGKELLYSLDFLEKYYPTLIQINEELNEEWRKNG